MYFDELYYLSQNINRRKIGDYKVQLAIAQNPHTKNPRELWRIFEDMNTEKKQETLDVTGFELLKNAMRDNPRIVVK